MHIGLIIYGTLDTVSGGYLYDRQLVHHLEAAGHLVEIISLPWRDYVSRMSDNRSPLLFERLVETEFDVLLQDELNHPSLYALNPRLKNFVRYPIVSIVHHLIVSEAHSPKDLAFYRKIEQAYLHSCDAFIYNSQATKATVSNMLDDVPMRHVVATPAGDRFGGIEPSQLSTRSNQQGPLQIVSLGNLIPRKGIHLIFEAMARVKSYEIECRLIGSETVDPEYVSQLKQQVIQLELQDRVTFLGQIDDAEIERVLSESHVLVLPSQYEGFGIVYLEGMAFGLPAIGSSGGGAGEIITNRVDGYLVEPEDVDTLAERLAMLAGDRALLTRMSMAAWQRFKTYPTWEMSMRKVERFLIDVHKSLADG